MNAIEIQDIWQAIRESERSDEIQFLDDKILIKAEAVYLAQPRRAQSGAVGNKSFAEVAISPTFPGLG